MFLPGQKDHWKASHKLVCKKPETQRVEKEGGSEEEVGEGKPNPM